MKTAGNEIHEDRRQSKRVSVDWRAKYWSSEARVSSNGRYGAIFDFNEQGIRLLTPTRLAPNSRLQLEIIAPTGSRPIVAAGDVVWQNGQLQDRNFLWATGIRFAEIRDSNIVRLRNLVAESCIPGRPGKALPTKRSTPRGKSFRILRKSYDPASVADKVDLLSELLGTPLRHIRGCTYDTRFLQGNIENPIGVVQVPLGIAGPLSIRGKHAVGDFLVPMATTEGALVLTYDMGMRLLRLSGPVEVQVISKVVHITPMFPIRTDEDVHVTNFVERNFQEIRRITESDSSHLRLLKVEQRKLDDVLLLKFMFDTGDAHGLNMVNHATFNACKYIEARTGAFFYLRSHYSGIKHYSPLNE